MKKICSKAIMPVLLIIFTYIIWPKGEPGKQRRNADTSSSTVTEVSKSREPVRRKPVVQLKRESATTADSKEKAIDELGQDELEQLKEESPDAYDYIVNNNRLLEEGYGTTPLLTKNNPQVESVKEAISTGKNPERLSVAVKAPPFDAAKFRQDTQYRKDYLSQSVPSRAMQSLDPAQGVPAITRTSDYYQEVEQGVKIVLSVKATPDMPVTFTSIALGAFGNGLTSQTVLADSNGNASVEFLGMPGTGAETGIIASSPAASGQTKFKVFTKLKSIKR